MHYIYRKVREFGAGEDLTIKLFGGAQVLLNNERKLLGDMTSVGMKNVTRAQEILAELGLTVAKSDIGGNRGRKLFFSIMNGDVYVARLGSKDPVVRELCA
jgi:chemotaxis protein CheD